MWAAELWQDIAAHVENLVVKVHKFTYPRVMPLKNIETMSRWTTLLELSGSGGSGLGS